MLAAAALPYAQNSRCAQAVARITVAAAPAPNALLSSCAQPAARSTSAACLPFQSQRYDGRQSHASCGAAGRGVLLRAAASSSSGSSVVVLTQPDGSSITFEKDDYVVGTAEVADIKINGCNCSAEHALIERKGGRVFCTGATPLSCTARRRAACAGASTLHLPAEQVLGAMLLTSERQLDADCSCGPQLWQGTRTIFSATPTRGWATTNCDRASRTSWRQDRASPLVCPHSHPGGAGRLSYGREA